jgi:hypothetical protein
MIPVNGFLKFILKREASRSVGFSIFLRSVLSVFISPSPLRLSKCVLSGWGPRFPLWLGFLIKGVSSDQNDKAQRESRRIGLSLIDFWLIVDYSSRAESNRGSPAKGSKTHGASEAPRPKGRGFPVRSFRL